MSITAKSNYGTKLQLKISSTYTDIGGVYTVPDLDSTEESIEVTHHGSGPYRERIPSGLSDPGEYTFSMRVDKTDPAQVQLASMKSAGTKGSFKIVWTDGHTKAFDAYVTGIKRNDADATGPDAINADVTLAIAGEVTEEDDSL